MTNDTVLPVSTLAQPARAQTSERWLVVLGFLAIYGIWSSTYLAIRYTVESGAPFLAAGLRVIIAGTILYGWRRGLGAIVEAGQWRATWISGSLMFLGGYGLLFWAEQHVPSGMAALLLAAIPLWVVLFEGRPWDLRTGLGLAVGLAGIGVLAGPEALGSGKISGVAVAALLGAGASWAAGTSYSHRAAQPRDSALAAGMSMIWGGAQLLLLSYAAGEPALGLGFVTPRFLAALAYLIVFGSLAGFTAYMWLLRRCSPVLVASYAFVNPVIAVFIGWALAGEPITQQTLYASALIVTAVVLVTLSIRKEKS